MFVLKMCFINNGDNFYDYYVLIIIITYHYKIKRPLLNYSIDSREPHVSDIVWPAVLLYCEINDNQILLNIECSELKNLVDIVMKVKPT